MRKEQGIVAGVVLCALWLAVPDAVFGQATITADGRKLYALLDCQDDSGSSSWGPTTWTPGSIGAAFNQTLEYHGISPGAEVHADGIAVQSSSLNGSTDFTSLTASGSAYGFANNTGFGTANNGYANVESYFFVTFQIATAQDYTLTGSLSRDSVSGPSVRLRLRPLGGADIHYSIVAGAFDYQGTLQPGSYELQARAVSLYNGSSYYNRTASYDNVTFTLVPEPSALALLALGLPLLRRSRVRCGSMG